MTFDLEIETVLASPEGQALYTAAKANNYNASRMIKNVENIGTIYWDVLAANGYGPRGFKGFNPVPYKMHFTELLDYMKEREADGAQ